MEDFLGVTRFDRSTPQPQLTRHGQDYCATVSPAMHALCAASLCMRETQTGGPVRLMAPQSLVLSWLMPRLAHLGRDEPPVDLSLNVSRDLRRVQNGEADVVIFAVTEAPPGMPCDSLLPLSLYLVLLCP